MTTYRAELRSAGASPRLKMCRLISVTGAVSVHLRDCGCARPSPRLLLCRRNATTVAAPSMAPRLGGVCDCAFVTTTSKSRRPCPWHRPCVSVPLFFLSASDCWCACFQSRVVSSFCASLCTSRNKCSPSYKPIALTKNGTSRVLVIFTMPPCIAAPMLTHVITYGGNSQLKRRLAPTLSR